MKPPKKYSFAWLRQRAAIWKQRKLAAEWTTLLQGNQTNAETFERIYRRKLWVRSAPLGMQSKSLSGHGSNLESTRVFSSELERFLKAHSVKVLFDGPCGDFHWMQHQCFPPACNYIGGDIVSHLIKILTATYGYEYRSGSAADFPPCSREFRRFDITRDEFPLADAWLCKDCIAHLSNNDIFKTLENFSTSSITFALITNHKQVTVNRDIRTGDFRHVDLTLEPFSLPKPVEILADLPVDGEPRYVGV